MKNITPKHVLISLIAAAILIPLLVFGWNELQTQPLDITMNAVKITADGRVFDEGEICIRGNIKKELFRNTRYLDASEIRILDKEYPTSNDSSYVVTVNNLEDWDNQIFISGLVYDSEPNHFISILVTVAEDDSWCVVKLGGKNQEFYFVGSTDPNPDYLSILANNPF